MDEVKLKKILVSNFFRYLDIASQSDPSSINIPSSKGQLSLAKLLAKELEELDLVDIVINDYGVLQARLKARGIKKEEAEKIGRVCHLDTVDVGLDDEISYQIIKAYDGRDIILDEDLGAVISSKDDPEILSYLGDDIITTKGKSVLGADNKAAIANVMTALSYLKDNPALKHGDIYLAFVPDEEIGLRGSRKIDFEKFDVDFAYTIDSCELGELVYETFNAASGRIDIRGISAHPMSAKNKLINPIMVSHDLISLLDESKMPEHTEAREGYIWITDIKADVLNARIDFNIRNHDREEFDQAKKYIGKIVDITKRKYKNADISFSIKDTYANIKDSITADNKKALDYLYRSFDKLSIKIKEIPMRGGTDGSYLSSRGILTPNYFTGAHNFHSYKEFLPIESFYKSLQVTLDLMLVD
ncbi:MAG: peptidase T [Tissierellia bacterium]|nr:peptidase T [Tissierellia bacterium]